MPRSHMHSRFRASPHGAGSVWVGGWLLSAAACAIPAVSSASEPGRVPANAGAQALGTADVHVHMAQPGDTLIGLSERLLARPADWPQLQKLNRIADPRRIPVGTAVRIPVSWLKGVPRDGEIITVSGRAMVAAPLGHAQAAQAGMRWNPGHQIQTGPDGYVTVKLADGSLIRIQSSTTVTLQDSQQYEAPGYFANLLQVLRGRIEAAVAHLTGGQPRFQVRTPQATVGVRGTDFRVATDDTTHTSQSEVLTGRVALRGNDQPGQPPSTHLDPHTELKAGQGARVDAQARVSPPSALPMPPVLEALPGLHERPLVRLSLPAVPGATGYRAQVATDASFQDVRAEVLSDNPELRIAGLPDGLWHLRVRTVNALGLEGADATRTFQLQARPEPPQPLAPAPHAKHRGAELPLQWAQPEGAAAYRLQVSGSPRFDGELAHDLRTQDTQTRLALPVGTWHWRLASLTDSGRQGPWGDAQAVRVLPAPPDVPAPAVSETHLNFRWPAEPGQTHQLQMAPDRSFQQRVQEVSTEQAQAELPRPPAGGTWWVRVRSTDADGYVGPYSAPQKIVLPGCTTDGAGQCLRAQDGSIVRGRP